jgi:hypothetical protein
MNLRKWFGVILALGLIVALSPLNALAWRSPVGPQHRSFVPPRGHAYGFHGQRPPMYRHHQSQHWARRHHPYQHHRYGHNYRHSQAPWLSRHHNSGHYAQSGYQGYSRSPYYGYGQGY